MQLLLMLICHNIMLLSALSSLAERGRCMRRGKIEVSIFLNLSKKSLILTMLIFLQLISINIQENKVKGDKNGSITMDTK